MHAALRAALRAHKWKHAVVTSQHNVMVVWLLQQLLRCGWQQMGAKQAASGVPHLLVL